MIDSIDFSKCTGCSACVNICPRNCIKMIMNEEGFLYPTLEKENCIKCGTCLKVCQTNESKYIRCQGTFDQRAYICQNPNDDIRKECTSGGVFNLISKYIVENNGIVFGAILNENNYCIHTSTDRVDLMAFSGSKYVQSDLNTVYTEIKNNLKKNRLVCFSGTPCQIYGLRKYLNKEYDNLILIDLLCHGVPSPGIFSDYKQFLVRKFGSKIVKIKFRCKDRGYKYSAMRIDFENGKKYLRGIEADQYLRLFFSDIILRKSCYNCRFRTQNREGDITLFDCWHTKQYNSRMDEKLGTTSVLVNSNKGNKIFNEIKESLIYSEVEKDLCLKLDGDMTYRIIAEPESRKFFFDDYKEIEFENLLNKYVSVSFSMKMKNLIKNMLLHL